MTCLRPIHLDTLEDVSENNPNFVVNLEVGQPDSPEWSEALKIPWCISEVFISMRKFPRQAIVIKKTVFFFQNFGCSRYRPWLSTGENPHGHITSLQECRCLDVHVWPFWSFPLLVSLSGFIYGHSILVSLLTLNSIQRPVSTVTSWDCHWTCGPLLTKMPLCDTRLHKMV